jgi:signal peptidase
MAVITDRRDMSPGPPSEGPGTNRVQRGEAALFYSGLLAITALLVFGTLAVLAILPMLLPGYTSASITSGSMMPTLRVGDVVIAVENGGAVIDPETIVVYEDPRKHDLVTHRVVSINPDGSYVTKGDANGGSDRDPIPAANIQGKAKWIVPFVGLPRVWVAEGRWMLVALTIVTTALALWLSRFGFETRYNPWREEALSRVEVPA